MRPGRLVVGQWSQRCAAGSSCHVCFLNVSRTLARYTRVLQRYNAAGRAGRPGGGTRLLVPTVMEHGRAPRAAGAPPAPRAPRASWGRVPPHTRSCGKSQKVSRLHLGANHGGLSHPPVCTLGNITIQRQWKDDSLDQSWPRTKPSQTETGEGTRCCLSQYAHRACVCTHRPRTALRRLPPPRACTAPQG